MSYADCALRRMPVWGDDGQPRFYIQVLQSQPFPLGFGALTRRKAEALGINPDQPFPHAGALYLPSFKDWVSPIVEWAAE